LCYICLVAFCVPFGIKYAHALFVNTAKSDAFSGFYTHFWQQVTNALQTVGEKYKYEDQETVMLSVDFILIFKNR
jgi:hypothetical protein